MLRCFRDPGCSNRFFESFNDFMLFIPAVKIKVKENVGLTAFINFHVPNFALAQPSFYDSMLL